MHPPSRPHAPTLALACIATLLAILSPNSPASQEPTPTPTPTHDTPAVDFVADIQPVFEKHCSSCHGPDKQRGGYRLDVREIAMRGGDSQQPAILPGLPTESPLFRFVSGLDPDSPMPPKGPRLADPEINALKSWIQQGAPWPDNATIHLDDPRDWWSLRPLNPPPIPQAPPATHPIDAFIHARLAAEGWQPSPEADRRTLARRVAFDLTGLPPSPEDIDAFLADPSPNAYENLVDRLLASPHYGERWARHWLDVVHYGDTHGYDKDKPRPNAWPYRDYVIRSLNHDKPYDRFVQEQIAGDVLFPHSPEGIEALGFIAAGPWDFIGHEEVPESKTDGRIARHLDRDNMVANTIGTFASLTVHCAQCHDHKFDPIPMRDYFRLQAVFAAIDRTDRTYHPDPSLNRLREERETRVRSLAREEKLLRDAFAKAGGDALRQLDERIAAAKKPAATPDHPEFGWHSDIAADESTVKWVQVDLGRSLPIDRVVLTPARDSFNNIGDGFGFPRRYRVEVSDDPSFASGVLTLTDHSASDQPNPGISPLTSPAAGIPARYIRITANRLAPRQNDFIFALAELEAFDPDGANLALRASVSSSDSIEAPPRWARVNLVDGRSPASPASPAPGTPRDTLASLEAERITLIERTIPQTLRNQLATTSADLQAARKALDELPAPSRVFVGAVHHGSGNFRGTGPDDGRPRPIHLLSRGDVNQRGPEVTPGALQCVPTLPADFGLPDNHPEGARRAALARWLTDPANPLTWRSIVNRVWQYHFGAGIVDTPNDFGRMGGRPSHPDLLDWLASHFRDGNRSLKSLHRLIVTSATYRQSSRPPNPNPDNPLSPANLDSANRLLWRMNPRRLEAEAVRDAILAVSGKLDTTPFGPGFQDFIIEKPEHSPHYQYHLHDPEDPQTHRRSIYRFLVRSQLEPFMNALDCADPSMRVDRRNETLTPLQALALLNGRLSVTMARHFAQRVESETGSNAPPTEKIRRALTLALQRPPSPTELATLEPYTARHGLAATCRVILNLNEFVFVD